MFTDLFIFIRSITPFQRFNLILVQALMTFLHRKPRKRTTLDTCLHYPQESTVSITHIDTIIEPPKVQVFQVSPKSLKEFILQSLLSYSISYAQSDLFKRFNLTLVQTLMIFLRRLELTYLLSGHYLQESAHDDYLQSMIKSGPGLGHHRSTKSYGKQTDADYESL